MVGKRLRKKVAEPRQAANVAIMVVITIATGISVKVEVARVSRSKIVSETRSLDSRSKA